MKTKSTALINVFTNETNEALASLVSDIFDSKKVGVISDRLTPFVKKLKETLSNLTASDLTVIAENQLQEEVYKRFIDLVKEN